MDETELKLIIESLLMTTEDPLSLEQLQAVFDDWHKPSLELIQIALIRLQEDYASRAIELLQVATGYKIQTKSTFSQWISRLQVEKPVKYSRALLETLAIIAYKQPVTRGDIEEIRGVAVNSHIMKTLLEREWIRVAGHRDVPGKPAVYTTTKDFLNYFNLDHLNQLPPLAPVEESEKEYTYNE